MYVDWATKIIYVFKADMILLQSNPIEIYQLNLNDFRLNLKSLEDDEDGIVYVRTHNHVAPVSVGGVDLARVVEILDPYTVTFEDDQYAVNLVGANSNVGDKVNVNQVSVRSANSAGLPDLEAIQSGSYNGYVTVRADSPYTGTTYPVGTNGYPVNNIPDARAIAAKQSLDSMKVLGPFTFDTGDDISYFKVYGQNAAQSQFIINDGAETLGAQIVDAYVTGNLDGGTLLERCVLSNLNYINGFIFQCMINPGTISLGGTTTAHFMQCFSGVPGLDTPTIDCDGAGVHDTPLAIRDYNGGIKLIDKTGPGSCSIDLASGQVVIDSSCTNGTIVVRGDGKVYDENGNNMVSGTYNGNLNLVNECQFGVQVQEIWQDMGLDRLNPTAYTDNGTTTTKTSGNVTVEITDTTITRQ